jgi:hypothetical protein
MGIIRTVVGRGIIKGKLLQQTVFGQKDPCKLKPRPRPKPKQHSGILFESAAGVGWAFFQFLYSS